MDDRLLTSDSYNAWIRGVKRNEANNTYDVVGSFARLFHPRILMAHPGPFAKLILSRKANRRWNGLLAGHPDIYNVVALGCRKNVFIFEYACNTPAFRGRGTAW